MKRLLRNQTAIYAGIQIRYGNIYFNYRKDDKLNDVVFLKDDVSGTYDDDDVEYVYAYQYNPESGQEYRKQVRNFLKSLNGTSDIDTDDDIDEFVENGVLKLDSYHKIKDFGAVVYVKSSKNPSLTQVIGHHLAEHADPQSWLSFKLLKSTYEHVQFDSEKAKEAMKAAGYGEGRAAELVEEALHTFENLKTTGKLFEMKKFLPRPLRNGFYNFLRFENKEEKSTYMSLQGVDVLIYDDFLTSGSTVKEIVRYLRSFHDQNSLTVFVLVRQ